MSARSTAAGWELSGRIHPAALLIAVLLHVLAVALMLRAGRVRPPPVTVSLSLATAPSSVLQGSANPGQALQPVATPPPPVTANAPPQPVAARPLPPVLSSVSPAAPLTPLPPPQTIRAARPPPALPLPPPLAPPPPPERVTPRRPVLRPAPPPAATAPPRHVVAPALPRSAPLAPPSARLQRGPGAQAPSGPVAETSSWLRAVSAWLNAHKFYPDLARQRGEQGTVMVRFVVARSGHVLAVSVARSSGSPILDRATQRLLSGAALPPLPPSMPGKEKAVTFAVRYLLEP